LSEGAVPARIHVANVSRRFPELLIALAESRISLTVAALLAPHLTEDNVDSRIALGRNGGRPRSTSLRSGRSRSSSRRSGSALRLRCTMSRRQLRRRLHLHPHPP
jgi:hypothetical protein